MMSSRWRLEIHNETKARGSILSSSSSMTFPPLDRRSRKIVGEHFLCGCPITLTNRNLLAFSIFAVRASMLNEISGDARGALSKLSAGGQGNKRRMPLVPIRIFPV